MNLHLMLDEKFIDYFIEVTEDIIPDTNKYVIYLSKNNQTVEYVKHQKAETRFWNTGAFQEIYQTIEKYEKIFIHNLSEEMVEFINKISDRCSGKIHWIVYGIDIFRPQVLYWNFLYGRYTREFVLKNYLVFKYLPWRLSEIIFKSISKLIKLGEYSRRKRAIGSIDYCMHWNEKDLNLLSGHYQHKMDFLDFNYFDIPVNIKRIKGIKAESITKNGQEIDVVIGNSAMPTNNHPDVFEYVKGTLNKKNVTIHSFLSYGVNNYKNFVNKKGKECFGSKFNPINDFLSTDDFYKMLNSFDAGIFGSTRTQAGSNIVGLLLLGKKVFLKKENTIYQMFKENNLHVFNFEEISYEEIATPLKPEQIEANISFFTSKYNLSTSKERLKKIIG